MSPTFAVAFLLLAVGSASNAAPTLSADPCTAISGQTYIPPADALACIKSFPFNETLRQNVLTNVARVFDFFTFEEYYLESPPPFEESTVNIRDELDRINKTDYKVNHSVFSPYRLPVRLSALRF
jgi:hypothetical protein